MPSPIMKYFASINSQQRKKIKFMPEKITKTKGGRYRVTGPSGVHAKGTTLAKAKAQVRIIEAADKKKHK
jgi:hypothetical protein